MELHLNSSLQTFFWGVCHHVPRPTPASLLRAGTRSHKARVQYWARITAGTEPLSSVLDLISGTALFPARQGRYQVGQCTGGMFEPLPWPALVHCVESSRKNICQFQVYSRASGYQILPFLPFPCPLAFPDTQRVTSSSHDSHNWVTQRCPDSEGVSRVTWLSTPKENQARNSRSEKPTVD